MRIYIGNMPYGITSEDLSELFGEYGHVQDATVIMDRETGRSKGFGFVEMPNNGEADRAIKELNSTQLQGRMITVNQARPRGDRMRR
ncbi:MAG: RNA-binding protein [Gammaproteobacteria bacterium]|nr:RNA-binding protein [Gammaproteobacteria bacterium]MYE10311.1 RNA-binding protein [Gammaproteobacteria bacterium]